MQPVTQRVDGASLDLDEVLAVYRASGLGQRRPIHERDRFAAMLRNANLVITARLDGELIGIARSISDFAYATYLSDIAVVQRHQRAGVGRALIAATQAEAPTAKVILLSAPAATRYYPHIGFTPHDSAWVLDPAVSPVPTR
ncbi:GNAT family N-acetyltransferase [Dactylosporangium aurantiacum]|uniref:GNAT family N-acetyltransferase n=1 Tax=Dactylosporangium aurantiacum TaxID=35754 RepID=A0A9Q9MDX1_9ACTN|nr:GNAT family N-acetyltransferase [Dactylosporangium aurantiacum]MDG6106608.1 GNAT family N-acetyltransferase [Dactylosporangium aurantiacum]UWZ50770.1 GNAT family N-acetyltransferase [Dactylosporangium aurantiacum]